MWFARLAAVRSIPPAPTKRLRATIKMRIASVLCATLSSPLRASKVSSVPLRARTRTCAPTLFASFRDDFTPRRADSARDNDALFRELSDVFRHLHYHPVISFSGLV